MPVLEIRNDTPSLQCTVFYLRGLFFIAYFDSTWCSYKNKIIDAACGALLTGIKHFFGDKVNNQSWDFSPLFVPNSVKNKQIEKNEKCRRALTRAASLLRFQCNGRNMGAHGVTWRNMTKCHFFLSLQNKFKQESPVLSPQLKQSYCEMFLRLFSGIWPQRGIFVFRLYFHESTVKTEQAGPHNVLKCVAFTFTCCSVFLFH